VYVADAWQHRYHPIKNYLMGLKFEGGDPITEVGNCFQDEYGMFQTWLRRWLIGAVARVMAGEQNRVLILDGAQGLGKDYFAHWLCSSRLEYFYEGPIMPDDKDCRLRRMWTWIWNMTEFGATSRRAERDALKAFITTQEVRDRKPYGRYDIHGTAMSSFIGTVNNEIGILTDPTGNRRFMISHILSIDWSYTRIDVDQLWAQAYELYMSGESWNLVGAELVRAEEINEFYQTVDVVEETIKKLFTIDPANTTAWLSTVDILETLKDPIRGNLRAGTEVDARRLAAALTKMGLGKPSARKIHNQVIRGYYGIQKIPTIP
jgi:predicted P-loop ATPase